MMSISSPGFHLARAAAASLGQPQLQASKMIPFSKTMRKLLPIVSCLSKMKISCAKTSVEKRKIKIFFMKRSLALRMAKGVGFCQCMKRYGAVCLGDGNRVITA